MDKTGLDGTFLAACCRFTTLALVVASVFVSTVVIYQGFAQNFGVARISDSNKFHSSALHSSSAGPSSANSNTRNHGELRPCQPADDSSSSIVAEESPAVAWRASRQVSSDTSRTGYLRLDHLSVDTVVSRQGKRGFKQLTVYFSNVSCHSGLVQVRPEFREHAGYGSKGECNETSGQWQKRRVPRHSQLAYTVVIPCTGNPSSLTFYFRGFSSDRVLTVQQSGMSVQESQLVENKTVEYMGSAIKSHGFNALPDSEPQIADKI